MVSLLRDAKHGLCLIDLRDGNVVFGEQRCDAVVVVLSKAKLRLGGRLGGSSVLDGSLSGKIVGLGRAYAAL